MYCSEKGNRKALIVALLTITSDYSSESTIFVRYKHISLSMQVLLEYSLVLMNNNGDVTFGHFRTCPFGCRHVGGQKCFAVIERNVLNVSLFINTSDCSNKTCMEKFMCLYLTIMVVSLE